MMRALRWALGVIAVVAVLFILGMIVPKPFASRTAELPTRRILLISNPIHTDIAIAIDDEVRSRFAFATEAGVPLDELNARWLMLGWGSRAFYIETPTWSELKPLPLLRALTVDASAFHLQVTGEIPADHPDVMAFDIAEGDYQRMLDHIDASFLGSAGVPVAIPDAAYSTSDAFFEANGRFNALIGCNTWTAGTLRSAGLTTGWWNPTPWSLRMSISLYNGDALARSGGVQP